jgi:hypothetical protein
MKRTFPSTIEVNLEGASHSTIIAAACLVMRKGGARAWDLAEWRAKAIAPSCSIEPLKLAFAIAGAIALARFHYNHTNKAEESVAIAAGA